jgi:ethanolamine utilization protein EutA
VVFCCFAEEPALPHDFELDHEHEHDSGLHDAKNAKSIWDQDHIVFQTVGIDIGSSTSHLLFSRVHLHRHAHGLSSHFEVIGREVIWQSAIVFTPFKSDASIDAHLLEHFIEDSFNAAGLKREDIDTGAVILTGEAIKKNNARAINQIVVLCARRRAINWRQCLQRTAQARVLCPSRVRNARCTSILAEGPPSWR